MAKPEEDTSIVERVANAIRSAHIAQARHKLEEQELPLNRIEGAFEVACKEADRSASILLFALAEDLMLSCFKANMNPKVHGGWNSVTGGNGVLATASDRLSLLELLYWIKPSTAADLRLMKSIRNRFAHHADVHSFVDSKVSGWICLLTPREIPMQLTVTNQRQDKLSLRELYLIRSISTVVSLATDLAVGPIAMQERIHPDSLVAGDFDTLPENMKHALRVQAKLMLSIYEGEGTKIA